MPSFDEMSASYGIVNLIASFGFSARWRHEVVRGLPLGEAACVVDLMSGMCELCRSLSRHAPPTIHLTAVDISPEMIRRARKDWPFALECLLEDVLTWAFEPG